MALHNINTIQNQDDLAYVISQSSEHYNYEALANLGQRYSIKGDGIKTNCFTVADILNFTINETNDSQGSVDKTNYITKLYISNKKLFLSLYSTNDLIEPIITEEIKYSLDNAVYSDAPITLNTKINGIDYYKENLLTFLYDKKYFFIASLGCDSAENTIYELNVECYNIKTNQLVESMKFIDTNENTHNEFDTNGKNTPLYYLYYLKNKDNKYTVSEYKIATSNIDIMYQNFQSFVLSFYNTIILEYYKSYNTLTIYDIVQELVQFGFTTTSDKENIEVIFDQNNNQGYTVNIDNTQLQTVLHYIYNQETQMYLFMFEYYCNYVYKTDNNQLKKYILYKLFDKAYYDSVSTNANEIDKQRFELYIPLGYMFDYYVNDNDPFFIYSNETPVNIFFTQELLQYNTEFISSFYETDQSKMILCHSDEYETVILYKYNVEYNSKSSTIINNINIEKLYSTPYIMDDYWVINNFKSLYRAVGKDAGNPNIMVIYNGGSVDSKDFNTENGICILSTVDDNIITDSMFWEERVVKVKLFDKKFINKYNNTNLTKFNEYYDIVSYLPTAKTVSDTDNDGNGNTIINIELGEKLKNTFIFNLTRINVKTIPDSAWDTNLSSLLSEYYCGNNYITTLWKYDSLHHEFNPVYDPNSENSIGLTFSDLSNVHSISYKMAEMLNDLANSNTNQFNEIILENTKALKNDTTLENGEVITTTKITHYKFNTSSNLHKTRLSKTFDFNNYNNNNVISLHSEYSVKDEAYLVPDANITNTVNIINLGEKYTNNDNENSKTTTYEYILNNSVPTVQLNEVLLSDAQLLNRTNILTVEKGDGTGKIYYSYIGSSIDEKNKNVLHIGSSNINPSIGIGSLTKDDYTDKFAVQDTVSLDFEHIHLNASYIYTNDAKHISKIYSNDTHTYYLIEGKYNIKFTDDTVLKIKQYPDQPSTYYNFTIHNIENEKTINVQSFSYDTQTTQAFRLTFTDNGVTQDFAIIRESVVFNTLLGDGDYIKNYNCHSLKTDGNVINQSIHYICTDIVKYNLCPSDVVYLPYSLEISYDNIYGKVDNAYLTFTSDKNTEYSFVWNKQYDSSTTTYYGTTNQL